MKLLKRIWDTLTYPFVAYEVLMDESRRINENGEWDKYWERQNRKMMKKEQKLAKKAEKRRSLKHEKHKNKKTDA